jgi:uncharacterized membrane protein YbaN (DUF454 family)
MTSAGARSSEHQPSPVSTAADDPLDSSLGRRLVWIPVGVLCVGLGGLGLVLPGLPATIFFIAAAAAFSRSSPRLERWVLTRPGIGPMVQAHRAGLGMPRRAKVVAIAMMATAIAVSVATLDHLGVRLGLVALGVVGAVAIVRVRPTTR